MIDLNEFVLELPDMLSSDVCSELIDTYDDFVSPNIDLISRKGLAQNRKAFVPVDNLANYMSMNAKDSLTDAIIRIRCKYTEAIQERGLDRDDVLLKAFQVANPTVDLSCMNPGEKSSNHFYKDTNGSAMIGIIFLNECQNEEGFVKLAHGLRIEAKIGKVVLFPSSWMYAFDNTAFIKDHKYTVYILM